VTAGNLSGNDVENTSVAWRKLRAFSFQTPFVETSIQTEFDVFKAVFGDRQRDKDNTFSAHLLFGVGISHISPMVNFNEPNPVTELVGLDKNADYNHNQIVIPYGLVVKWHINDVAAIRLAGTVRKTFSDYFDGISKSALASNNDVYMTATIGWEQTLSWGLTGWDKRRFTEGGVYCPHF
jgi:OmpA-OmpF porin, OOP family